jgi:hypothetical protein
VYESAGTGTVTSITAGSGLSGGTITTTGIIALAAIANNTILSNISGGSAVPVGNSLSALLDTIGSTQGAILYRGSASWAILPPGSSGQYLQTQGASANPLWATNTASGAVSAGTVNQLTYYAASGTTVSGLATANNGVLVTSVAGVPSISTTLPSGLTIPGYQPTITPAALTEVNDTNVTMTLGGTPSTALLQAVSMTLGWTGQLSLARGGTAANLTASTGGIVYSGSSALAILAGTATANQILLSGSSAAPAWSTATYPSVTTINQILYSSSANVISGINAANNGVMISGTTGIPSFLANSGTPGYVLTANSGAPPSWQAITAEGAITSINGDSGSITPSSGVVTISGGTTGLTTSGSSATLNLTGTLKLGNGGTNAALTASNGGIFYSTASAGAILSGTATANQVLLSGSSAAPAWSTATYPATTTINQILYSSSANVIAGITAVNSAVMISSAGGVPSFSTTLPSGLTIPGYQATITPAALTAGNDTNVTLTLGGTPSTALLQASSITAGWTGTLSLARGGTAANLTASNGGIFYSTASAGAILAGTATAQQLLMSGSSTTPQWSTTTYPTTNAINTLLYASSANVMAALATANSSVLVTSSGGVPSWSTTLPSGLSATNLTLVTPTLGGASATSLTFSSTTGIVGTTTNNNAASGSVGEFISSVIASGSAVTATSNAASDLTSISLTAGDWDVWGNISLVTLGTTPVGLQVWTSTSSATAPDKSLYNGFQTLTTSLVAGTGFSVPYHRYSFASTTTVYISAFLTNSSGNGSICGGIYARRVR